MIRIKPIAFMCNQFKINEHARHGHRDPVVMMYVMNLFFRIEQAEVIQPDGTTVVYPVSSDDLKALH
jgi:hypothetical protein